MNNLEEFVSQLPILLTVGISLAIGIEWLALTIAQKVDNQKESWVNIISAGLAFFPQFILTNLLLIGFMFWLHQFRLFELGFDWYYWVAAYIAYDFVFWLIHYAGHKVRIIWCLHNVHHSPKEMKLSVAFRGSFLDFVTGPHLVVWFPLLGFNPLMIFAVDAIAKLYGVATHINQHTYPDRKRHWIENILITPSAHRTHHSTNHIYLDTNFGTCLSIWDRLFGTYQSELDAETPVFGIMKDVDSGNLYDSQLNEFISLWKEVKTAPTLSDKIKYVFMPPGWNHLGTGILATDLRKEALATMTGSDRSAP